jgi:hypothetical protein
MFAPACLNASFLFEDLLSVFFDANLIFRC